VSAWAGIHYFASRHGFHAPGAESSEGGVLTWPEGNGWLTRQLAAPLGDRLHTGQVIVRIAETRQGVEVDAFNTASQALERWQARRAIVALPVFIAARVVHNPPDLLRQAAARTTYAPWLVANIHIATPLHDRPGPAPSWDNVLYNAPGLGYVDAMHQSLQPVPGATVLSYYRALGDVPFGRRVVLEKPWDRWRDEILAELATAHPDLAAKATRMDISRYGHAMAIPTPKPKNSSQIGLQPLLHRREQLQKPQRLAFAHSDWAGYSVFEEAFTLGHQAA
jgi:monoamine oxidase